MSHEWLFPQAACVVHHAGAGTTTVVLGAGVPHVPVVFIADQPYFAKNLRRLGVAVPKQWYYSMTASSLAKSIDLACTDSKLKQNAQQLRSQFVAENGILEAIELIEAHFKKMKQ